MYYIKSAKSIPTPPSAQLAANRPAAPAKGVADDVNDVESDSVVVVVVLDITEAAVIGVTRGVYVVVVLVVEVVVLVVEEDTVAKEEVVADVGVSETVTIETVGEGVRVVMIVVVVGKALIGEV